MRLSIGLGWTAGFLTLGCLSLSCTSADEPHQDLDVVTSSGSDAEAADAKSMTVAKQAVTDWQAFFKPPPNAKEVSILEQKLSKWPEPNSPNELLKKGRAEIATGRLPAAEADFRQALRIKPDFLEAHLELSALYLRKKNVTEAFAFLSQAKDIIATSDQIAESMIFRYRYTLALAYIARGERAKGHKVLSDLIGIDKTFAPAYVSLAASYLAEGKVAVAEFVVKRGLDRVKSSAALLNLMGALAVKTGQIESARTWFDKALSESPGYAPALVNRAALSAKALEYAAAEEDLKQALASDPQSVDAMVALGVIYRKLGNLSAARTTLTKAIDADPDAAYARFNLAVLFADELKKPTEALRLFHEVMQTSTPGSELNDLARSYVHDLNATPETY